MKYRKKPVIIDAIQWLGTRSSWDAVMTLGDIKWKPGKIGTETFTIETLEGEHLVQKGDYVIRGVKGEFYPCKPDIFELTYDELYEEANFNKTYKPTPCANCGICRFSMVMNKYDSRFSELSINTVDCFYDVKKDSDEIKSKHSTRQSVFGCAFFQEEQE